KESKNLEETRTRIAREQGSRIIALGTLSEILDARTKALSGASTTEATLLLQAWIPEAKSSEIAQEISKASGGLANMFVERKNRNHSTEESVHAKGSEPPTLVKAPGWTQPLQSIVDNFGFVFGDIFGFEARQVLGINPIFSPTAGAFPTNPSVLPSTANLIIYMVFILFFGVAHYLSGLAISAYNKIRNKEYRHALLGPIAWAWFYAAFITAAVLVVQANFKFSVLLKNPLVIASVFIPMALMGYGEGGLH